MILLSSLSFLLHLCHGLQEVELVHPEVNSSMGAQFLFAMPDLLDQDGRAALYIYCVINPKTLVSVFTYRLNRTTSVDRFHVINSTITTYTISSPGSAITGVGKKITYEVAAGVELGVFLVMSSKPASMAVVKLLPESHWGTEYFVVTLMTTPTIIITTNVDNRVNVVLRITPTDTTKLPDQLEIHFGNGVYRNGSALKFILKQKESFSLSMCNIKDNFALLIGSRIVAKEPVGVISGSCLTATTTLRCQDEKEVVSTSRDLAVESIPPVQMYGREFIMFNIPSRVSQGEITIFASNDTTTVTLNTEKSIRPERITLQKRGDWRTFRFNRSRSLVASRPVLAVFVLWAACLPDTRSKQKDRDVGDAALTVLIPVELFFFMYLWRIPDGMNVSHFAAMIYPLSILKTITLDGKTISIHRSSTQNVTGKTDWQVGHLNITAGNHTWAAPPKNMFAVYVYGMGKDVSYMSPAGYETIPINPKTDACQRTDVKPDDVIDNDCDGRIDEEEDNHEDDDFDGLVDEDTFIKLINGEWGRWSEWQCTHFCNISSVERRRKCDNPPPTNGGYNCEGKPFERRSHTCYIETTCPIDCPPYKWFEDCARSCYKCEGDCERFSGRCLSGSCKAGYFGALSGCNDECDLMAFGPNCNGSCEEKCNGPCSNSITGECPKNDYKTLSIILVVVSLVCAACFCAPVQNKKGHEGEDSSYTYTSSSSQSGGSDMGPGAVEGGGGGAGQKPPHPHHHHHHQQQHHHQQHLHHQQKHPAGAPQKQPPGGAANAKPKTN